VALARALAIKPRLLLLDEPVSALDEGLRDKVCRDLRKLQRELALTTIHVSHNMEEALAVSDWAAVLFDGRIAQVGAMKELLQKPKSIEVARFLRTENLIPAYATPISETETEVRFFESSICVPGKYKGPVTLCVRPEHLKVLPLSNGPRPNTLLAKLVDITDRGIYKRLSFESGAQLVSFTTQEEGHLSLVPGQTYLLYFSPERVHIIAEQA